VQHHVKQCLERPLHYQLQEGELLVYASVEEIFWWHQLSHYMVNNCITKESMYFFSFFLRGGQAAGLMLFGQVILIMKQE